MPSRILFGSLLLLVGILYFWLAYMSVWPSIQDNDIVSWLGAFLFLAAGVGAGFAGVNLVRPKRR
ncbi:MAG: hypothetical protein ABIQ44_15385 [Chloroflexia bacterium]